MKKLFYLIVTLLLIGCNNPVESEYEIGLNVERYGNIEQHEGNTTITWNPINEVDDYYCFVSYWSPYGIPGWREANLSLDLSSGVFTTNMIIREVNLTIINIDNSEIYENWLSEGYPDW